MSTSAPGPFETVVKVRFADVDHARVVYYPLFFHYFHLAFEDLFEACSGEPYSQVLDRENVGFPAVHSSCDYRAPARFGDRLRIRVTCTRVGSRSVTLRYRALREADGTLCAEGLVTTCCVDMRTFSSRPIPDAYRDLFSRLLEPGGE